MNCQDCKNCQNLGYTHHKKCGIDLPKEIIALILYNYTNGVGLENPSCIFFTNKETGEKVPLIDINPHGIENGWALWPFNFDPVWINSCMAFSDKNEVEEPQTESADEKKI